MEGQFCNYNQQDGWWLKYNHMIVFIISTAVNLKMKTKRLSAGKFGITAQEVEKKFIALRAAFTWHLRLMKLLPSGSRREEELSRKNSFLEWLRP